jgi:hypothetical protein
MSNFSMLRLMGKFPVKDVPVQTKNDEGEDVEVMTFRFVDAEEKEKLDAERAANSTAKTRAAKSPAERYEAAEKRVARCTKAAEAARARADKAEDNEELQLRADKADIELKLAEIEMDKASDNYSPEAEVSADGGDQDEDQVGNEPVEAETEAAFD